LTDTILADIADMVVPGMGLRDTANFQLAFMVLAGTE